MYCCCTTAATIPTYDRVMAVVRDAYSCKLCSGCRAMHESWAEVTTETKRVSLREPFLTPRSSVSPGRGGRTWRLPCFHARAACHSCRARPCTGRAATMHGAHPMQTATPGYSCCAASVHSRGAISKLWLANTELTDRWKRPSKLCGGRRTSGKGTRRLAVTVFQSSDSGSIIVLHT